MIEKAERDRRSTALRPRIVGRGEWTVVLRRRAGHRKTLAPAVADPRKPCSVLPAASPTCDQACLHGSPVPRALPPEPRGTSVLEVRTARTAAQLLLRFVDLVTRRFSEGLRAARVFSLVAVLASACLPSLPERECLVDEDCPGAPARTCHEFRCLPGATGGDGGGDSSDSAMRFDAAADGAVDSGAGADAASTDGDQMRDGSRTDGDGGPSADGGPLGDGGPTGDGGPPAEGGTPTDGGLPGDATSADALSGDASISPDASVFPYAPSNFDPALLPATTLAVAITCFNDSRFDSTLLTFTDWCGPEPPVSVVTQVGGPDAVVLSMASLDVAFGSRVILRGTRPVIFAVLGDAAIDGEVVASASFDVPGAGGVAGFGCAPGVAGGSAGGGGGGFGTPGGAGGSGDGVAGPPGGPALGSASLVPLRGGCPGGEGGDTGGQGGAGGGGLQISSAGRLSVTGAVRAGGGGGEGAGRQQGGGGGGSGGGIFLEGDIVITGPSARVVANGGGGGEGGFGTFGSGGADGSNGGLSPGAGGSGGSMEGGNGGVGGGLPPPGPGISGAAGTGAGGGGGGGSAGRIRVRARSGCMFGTQVDFSPPAVTECPP